MGHQNPRSGHLCIGRTSLRTNVDQGDGHSAYLDCRCQMIGRRFFCWVKRLAPCPSQRPESSSSPSRCRTCMRNTEDSKPSSRHLQLNSWGMSCLHFHHVRGTGAWRKRLASTEPHPPWERGYRYLLQKCIRMGKMMTLALW